MTKQFKLGLLFILLFSFEFVSVSHIYAWHEIIRYHYHSRPYTKPYSYYYRYDYYYPDVYFYYPGHTELYYKYETCPIPFISSDIHYNGYHDDECIKGCGIDSYYKLIFDEHSNNPKVSKYAYSVNKEYEDRGDNWVVYLYHHKDMYAFLNLLEKIFGYEKYKKIVESHRKFLIGSDRVYIYPHSCRLVKSPELDEFEKSHTNITYF